MKKMDVVKLKQVEHVYSEKFLLSNIRFPFIIQLYGTFKDQRNIYMLLEYAIGGELFTYLRRAGKFSVADTKFYASEIVLALEYMHSMNIVYRDLKPENLLLDSNGHIKITDFGFAKIVHDRTWTLCGTPEYLAPEIIQSTGHGKAVDWWALGILIYEMLAGFPPFYDDNHFVVYEKILSGQLVFPSHFDAASIDLIRRLLVRDKSKRLGNMKNGANDVKMHPWFHGVDWKATLERNVAVPIVPVCRHQGDTSNFEKYDEVEEEPLPENYVDPYRNYFQDF